MYVAPLGAPFTSLTEAEEGLTASAKVINAGIVPRPVMRQI